MSQSPANSSGNANANGSASGNADSTPTSSPGKSASQPASPLMSAPSAYQNGNGMASAPFSGGTVGGATSSVAASDDPAVPKPRPRDAGPGSAPVPVRPNLPSPVDGELTLLHPDDLVFWREPDGVLQLEILGRLCYLRVKLVPLFPIRYPTRYLSVREGNGKEIGIIEDLTRLSVQNRHLVDEDLRLTRHIPMVREVHAIQPEHGYFLWSVETDRGPRIFYVKGRTANIWFHRTGRWFVTDIDDCRYELPPLAAQSRHTRRQLDAIL